MAAGSCERLALGQLDREPRHQWSGGSRAPEHPCGRGGDSGEDWTDLSDQGAFRDARVPFVYFGVEDHADYHKPTDTVDKIDPTFFGNAADMIVEALVALDRKLH